MNIKKIMKNKKGFTLIEIIVVVVILAVLMAVAVPSVLKYMGEADNAKYMSQARGQVIETQNEVAKEYSKATEKSEFTAAAKIMVKGTPKVKSVVLYKTDPVTISDNTWSNDGVAMVKGDNPEIITSYEITFEDTTKALVRANQNVVIDPR